MGEVMNILIGKDIDILRGGKARPDVGKTRWCTHAEQRKGQQDLLDNVCVHKEEYCFR